MNLSYTGFDNGSGYSGEEVLSPSGGGGNSGGGMAALGGGGAIGAFGQLYAGAMTANSLDAQADLADEQANEARRAGVFNSMRMMRHANQVMGSATANFGASGVSASGGSATAILGASAANAELDRLNIIHQADIRATNYENQATLDRFGGSAARTGSIFAAAGTLATAGGKAAAAGA